MQAASALAGRRIIVTRPEGQARALCEALAARGATAECAPVMAIEAVPVSGELARIVARLDDYALAFFVSANAVRFGLEAVRAKRSWPASVAVATVGPGSQRALEAAGFDPVIAPAEGFDSEAVLALPAFSPARVQGQGIVIFRGNGGRDLLGDTLVARGATVDYAACYRRTLPAAGGERLLALAGSADAIVLTSSEGVGNLLAMLGGQLDRLLDIAAVCPHPRIAARARDLGFATVLETAPGDAGMIEGMEHYFQG